MASKKCQPASIYPPTATTHVPPKNVAPIRILRHELLKWSKLSIAAPRHAVRDAAGVLDRCEMRHNDCKWRAADAILHTNGANATLIKAFHTSFFEVSMAALESGAANSLSSTRITNRRGAKKKAVQSPAWPTPCPRGVGPLGPQTCTLSTRTGRHRRRQTA